VDIRTAAEELLGEATGRRCRDDATLPGTGGPAGNARLTAWTGMVLLVLFLAELVTLLDVRGLISWHVALGVLLVPPSLLKTASTGWRIVRYYSGNPAYRRAGPPTIVLRILGPLVVASTLATLGTGIALILIRPETAVHALARPIGYPITPLLLHQACFVIWAVATGVHALARLIPALRMTVAPAVRRRVPGAAARGSALALAAAVAAAGAVLAVSVDGPWHDAHPFGHARHAHSRER